MIPITTLIFLSILNKIDTTGGSKFSRMKRNSQQNTAFPLEQFLGLNDKINFDEERLKLHLCETEIFMPFERACDCDDKCLITGTCCMDIFWKRYGFIDLVEYKRLLIDRAQDFKIYHCVKMLPWTDNENQNYLMINTCLPNTPEDLKQNCTHRYKESLASYLPVFGHDNNTYSNKYCARCHHVYQYRMAKLMFHETNSRPFITFTFHEYSRDGKRCDISLMNYGNCSKKNKNYQLCHSYLSPVSGYRNLNCLKCSENIEDLDGVEFHLQRQVSTEIPWSRLIVITENSMTAYEDIEMVPLQLKTHSLCREYVEESNLLERNCKKNPLYDSCAERANQYLVTQNMKASSNDLRSYLNFSENDFVSISEKSDTLEFIRPLSSKEIVRVFLFHTREKDYFTKENASIVLSSSASFLHNSSNHIDFYKIFPDNRICHRPMIFEETLVNFTSACSIRHGGIMHKESNILFITTFDYNGVTKKVVLCKDICNSSTVINLRNHTENRSEIITAFSRNQEVLPFTNCLTKIPSLILSKILKIEIYVSYIGTSVSIVGYVVVISTYMSYERFKNSAGMCTLALTSSLLVADSMYLTAGILSYTRVAQIFPLCKTVAIIFHFAMLMAQLWCIVIAYDLKKNITRFDIDEATVKFKIYLILTSTACFLIIVSAFIVDLEGIVKIGYGEEGTCLPHKKQGLLYFYIAPTILSFSISTAFIIAILLKISTEISRSENTLRDSRRAKVNMVLVAFKLFLILGISEGIGFVQVMYAGKESDAYILNVVVGSIYTLARSLRGMLMALAYLCKKDIFVMYRMSFNKMTHPRKAKRAKNISVNSMDDSVETKL